MVESPGPALDPAVREYMEPRFSHDFSRVRVHTDSRAAESARAVGAPAYTVGRDIVFGAGRYEPGTDHGRRLLAHELAHVVQQANSAAFSGVLAPAPVSGGTDEREAAAASEAVHDGFAASPLRFRAGSRPFLQRYEAGEHAQFGEAGEALAALVAKRAFNYKVKPGDTLAAIASKFHITLEDLRAANMSKLRTWKASSGTVSAVQGFNAGDTVLIPPVLNEAVKDALKAKELTFIVSGVTLDYGKGIAMGDLFEAPEQMLSAPDAKLKELSRLIQKDKSGPAGVVTTKEWNAATGGQYLELAQKNEAHFAPSNSAFVPASGSVGADHKSSWEKYHTLAIREAQAGNRDKALAINAFADHFLTDAFAAGHLFNRRDLMNFFNSRLTVNPKGEFTADSVAFFDAVAAAAFVGPVQTEFSQHETVEYKGGFFRPNINSVSRFSILLQEIHKREPSLLSGAVVKAVHDTLNREPGGVPVENNMGDKWDLSGDKTLNTDSKRVARTAVAQSQLNVLDSFKLIGPIDLPAEFKKVWDYVPHPTPAGEATVHKEVTSGTDPKSGSLINAVVALIKDNYKLIIDELVKRKVLKRA